MFHWIPNHFKLSPSLSNWQTFWNSKLHLQPLLKEELRLPRHWLEMTKHDSFNFAIWLCLLFDFKHSGIQRSLGIDLWFEFFNSLRHLPYFFYNFELTHITSVLPWEKSWAFLFSSMFFDLKKWIDSAICLLNSDSSWVFFY